MFERVLRDRALRHRDHGHFLQNRRPAHRDSVTVVQRMGHGFDPRAQSMRRGAILVRPYVRVLPPRLPAAFPAAADLHLEQADFRFCRCRHVRHRYFFRFFLFQGSSAEGAAGLLDGNVDRGLAAGINGRREKAPCPGLRPGRFGFCFRSPLENGAALRLSLRRSSSFCFRNSSIRRCNSRINRIRSSRLWESKSRMKHYVLILFASLELLNPDTLSVANSR